MMFRAAVNSNNLFTSGRLNTYLAEIDRQAQEQHCQIGNHLIAINYIIGWLDKYFGK